MKISIIIPCYNEENYIINTLNKVNEQRKYFDLQIIVCDDGSNDQTINLLENNPHLFDKLIKSTKNKGKGNAIRNALDFLEGDITLIQDADLEYNPNDYKTLFEPFINDDADVVYGTRFGGGKKVRIFYYINRVANFFITNFTNALTNINFSDVETGYKAIKTKYFKELNLKENSFTIEIEITMKLSKIKKIKIYEVGISSSGRTYEEGKKIKMIDGFKAIYAIFKYKFFN